MLSKEEHKKLNQDFWDGFKKEMRQIPSSNGRRINWINYPTDVKSIFLRIVIDKNVVKLCFDIQPKDQGIKEILFEQMTELRKVMEASMTYQTNWIESLNTSDGRVISRISWENNEFNFYDRNDWREIYTFLKKRLVEFDNFYQEFKDILINLAD